MAYTIVTEIFYAGAWHDISADVRNRHPVSITRGAQDESARVQPGRMTFTLNNGTSRVNGVVGRYTPRNPSSDLYGLIGRNTPVRQSLDGIRRFQGEISEWPSRWGHDGAEVWISINAYGILRRLRQGGGTGVKAPLARCVELQPEQVDAEWLLDEEGPTAPDVGAPLVGDFPFRVVLADEGLRVDSGELAPWAGRGLLVGPGGSADPTVQPSITGTFTADVVMAAPVETRYEWAVDFLVRFPEGPAPVGNEADADSTVRLTWFLRGNGSPRLDWQIFFSTDYATGQGITAWAQDEALTVLGTTGFVGPHLADGQVHHVTLAVGDNGTARFVQVVVDGDSGTFAVTGSSTYPRQGLSEVSFNYDGRAPRPAPAVMGQMAIRSIDGQPLAMPTLHTVTTAAGQGHYTEPAGRRIERLCAENGIPFRGIGDLDDTEPLGHQYAAPLLELMEQAADTDGGILFEDRGPVNLLAGTDGTFEDGDDALWSGTNATVADTTEQAHSGSHSLKVTSTVASGTVSATTQLSAAAVVKPGEVITGACWVRPFGENFLDGSVALEFRDGGGVISTATGPVEPLLFNGFWILQSATAVAPAGTETCRISYGGTIGGGVGAGFYLDDVALTWGVEGSPPLDPSAPTGLAYATRRGLYNRPAMLELDYAGTASKGGHVSELTPVDDDQAVANDVTCQRPNGGSRQAVKVTGPLSVLPPPDGVGRYDRSATRNVPDDERLHAHAEALVNLGTIDQTRYPEATFRPRKFPELALRAAAVDSGDLVTIDNLPPWLPPEQIRCMALGYTERYSIADWEITWNTAPATPYEVGVLDVGRLDTDEATAGVDFEAGTDTALTVAWSGTAVADEGTTDFNIEAAGVVLHVTEITGSSSPQTFTVDAAPVNGVTKTIPAGTPVHLAKPWRLAF